MSEIPNQYRFLAAVVLECTTPLIIGSGNKTIKTDSQINTDCNGLPFIPGTTLTGILRHTFEERFANSGYNYDELFGYIRGKKGSGSRLIITEAKILDPEGIVIDGLQDADTWSKNRKDFLNQFSALPIRQHAKIGHQGTTVDGGKFDEEVIFKGTRFCFEMELVSNDATNKSFFEKALDVIASETFSIGGKTNSGFGKMKVHIIKYKYLNFDNKDQFDLYLDKSAQINYNWSAYTDYKPSEIEKGLTKYVLDLAPEDFIFFSSGFGNGNADNTSVKEKFVEWEGDKAHFVEAAQSILIPATSVKGAIAHRTAYHYNKLKGCFANKEANFDEITGKNNNAVFALFGSEGEKNAQGKTQNKRKGIAIFSDVLQVKKTTTREKVFNHVAIDRFTGGTIDGALFNGEYLYAKDEKITLEIFVDESKITKDKDDVIKAFELALADVKKGLLPLGGGVTKGNGTFSGKLTKNGEEIYGEN